MELRQSTARTRWSRCWSSARFLQPLPMRRRRRSCQLLSSAAQQQRQRKCAETELTHPRTCTGSDGRSTQQGGGKRRTQELPSPEAAQSTATAAAELRHLSPLKDANALMHVGVHRLCGPCVRTQAWCISSALLSAAAESAEAALPACGSARRMPHLRGSFSASTPLRLLPNIFACLLIGQAEWLPAEG